MLPGQRETGRTTRETDDPRKVRFVQTHRTTRAGRFAQQGMIRAILWMFRASKLLCYVSFKLRFKFLLRGALQITNVCHRSSSTRILTEIKGRFSSRKRSALVELNCSTIFVVRDQLVNRIYFRC